MDIYVPQKPLMSDAQFAALAAVDQRQGSVTVERFKDCNLTTLRSMASQLGRPATRRRHAPWVTLMFEGGTLIRGQMIGAEVVGAELTPAGIEAYDAERARRARKAAFEARLEVHTQPRSITYQADAFALVGARPDDIPF